MQQEYGPERYEALSEKEKQQLLQAFPGIYQHILSN